MADVITRFKLETTQYDSKLRDAAKSLRDFTHQARLGGKDFTNFSQKSLEAARALGTVASGANNTKDKVKDLVGAYNEAARAYNSLSQSQQQSDFGKALAASIGQLKDRLTEAKQELYGMGDAMKNAGGGGLFGGDGLKGMLQVFGGNLMTKAAGYVASLGSEIVNVMNESSMLARQAEGVQVAFRRLGDGSLLDGLREATHGTVNDFELMKAAVKFNDFKLPVEELGTMLAFAQQKAKDTGQSVDYMVDSIVTGLGRKSLMILDNLGLSAAEIKEKMAETGDMTKAVGEIIREQMSKAGDYVETAADRAAQANVDLENAMLELGNAMRETFGYDGWDTMAAGIKTELVGAITFTIETINEAKQRFMELLQLMGLADKELPKPSSSGQPGPNGAYWEKTDAQGNRLGAGRWMNGKQIQTEAADFVVTGSAPSASSSKRKGSSGGRSGGKSFDIDKIDFNKAVSKIDTESLKPEDITPMSVWEEYAEGIRGTFDTIGEEMGNLKEWTANFDPFKEKMDEANKAAKQQQMAFGMAAEAANNLGAAFAGMEDPAAKAAGTVISAIANIALGFAQASVQASSMGPWGWVAFLAAGAAAMATTISTVHSLTGYAEGGIIKGNTYSGDSIYAGSGAMVNAGELVLNRAQQGNLASQLEGGGMQNLRLSATIRGEDIKLALNNNSRRTGRGEYVTTNFR